jgi:hypothetical protein
MKVLKKIIKLTALILLSIVLLVATTYGIYRFIRNQRSNDLITIEAVYMQYACGDENDDMQVTLVSSKKYKFLVGHDIDPDTDNHRFDFKEYFYSNRTDKYGMRYRLKGYLSKYPDFGCDGEAPKFRVEEIERIDGKKNLRKKDF